MPRSLPPSALARALDAHCSRLSGCRRCTHAPGVFPIVSRARAPRAILVGQAPGQTEAGGGRPFAGRAGRTLFRWFEGAGLDESAVRDRVYIAAITRCYPGPAPSGRGDRVPSPTERARCSDWLDDELRLLHPALIIPVGRLAIDRFLGPAPLADLIGVEHEVQHAGGRSIAIPLPHPSGASSWIHDAGHKQLLAAAIALVGARLADVREMRTVA
ncbi:MAG: uracil-DNA glycosylase [Gemmatimonadaceae bacterium]|nr:uracil-DNA glycosylase [Gemmatimonadaceae bacterium]